MGQLTFGSPQFELWQLLPENPAVVPAFFVWYIIRENWQNGKKSENLPADVVT